MFNVFKYKVYVLKLILIRSYENKDDISIGLLSLWMYIFFCYMLFSFICSSFKKKIYSYRLIFQIIGMSKANNS